LALSGGGIRSATFCLGVVQVLAERRLLPMFDYLSTVSGGGYLGSFLSCALGSLPTPGEKSGAGHHAAAALRARFEEVFHRKGSGTESGLLRHLRNHSKYLLHGGQWARLEIAGLVVSGILWNLLMILPIPLAGAPGWSTIAGTLLRYLAYLLAGFWALLPLIQLLMHGKKPGSRGAMFRRVWERTTLAIGGGALLAGMFYLLPACFHGYEWIRNRLTDLGLISLLVDWWSAMAAGAGSVVVGALAAWLKPNWPRLRALLVRLFILSGPLFGLVVFLLAGNRLGLASQADPGWVAALPWAVLALVFWGWFCVNINTLAPHRYYRSRLCECYLTRRAAAEGLEVAPANGNMNPGPAQQAPTDEHTVSRGRKLFTGEYTQGRTESLQQVRLTELGASAQRRRALSPD
jgi:hypothetical protein